MLPRAAAQPPRSPRRHSPQTKFMGLATVSLGMYAHADELVKVQLTDAAGHKGKGRGEVTLRVQWRHDPSRVVKKKKSKGGLLGFGILGGSKVEEDEASDVEYDDDDDGAKKEALTPEQIEEEKKEVERRAAERAETTALLQATSIKSGDYEVHFHIIECRGLIAKDLQGTSDPIVYVEAFGQKQCTAQKNACVDCVFDEVFILAARDMDKEEVERATIKVSVYDADASIRCVLPCRCRCCCCCAAPALRLRARLPCVPPACRCCCCCDHGCSYHSLPPPPSFC